MAILLATEAAAAGNYPSTRFGARERKLLKCVYDSVSSGTDLPASVVTGKLITGFVSNPGVVAASDSILQALNKIDGNEIAGHALASAALPSASFTDAAVTGKLITGFVSGGGVVAASDTILQAVNKIDGNVASKQGIIPMDSKLCGTTGAGTAGRVLVTDFTAATGKVVCCIAEAPGLDIAFSHYVAQDGYFVVYGIDVDTKAVAPIEGKLISYMVISL